MKTNNWLVIIAFASIISMCLAACPPFEGNTLPRTVNPAFLPNPATAPTPAVIDSPDLIDQAARIDDKLQQLMQNNRTIRKNSQLTDREAARAQKALHRRMVAADTSEADWSPELAQLVHIHSDSVAACSPRLTGWQRFIQFFKRK